MNYTPTNWKNGDIITADKLNKIENGIAGAGGGGVMFVNITSDEVEGETVYSADKTFAEIAAAVEAGEMCFARVSYEDNHFLQLSMSGYSNTSEFKDITWERVGLMQETSPTPLLIFYHDFADLYNDGGADTVEYTHEEPSIPLS